MAYLSAANEAERKIPLFPPPILGSQIIIAQVKCLDSWNRRVMASGAYTTMMTEDWLAKSSTDRVLLPLNYALQPSFS